MTPKKRRILASVATLPALVGLLLFFRDTNDFPAIAFWVLIPNAVAGAFLAATSGLFVGFLSTDRGASARTLVASDRLFVDVALVLVPQLVGGLLSLALVIPTIIDEPSYVWVPVAFVIVGALGILFGVVLGFLVVWPVRTLGAAAVARSQGRPVDAVQALTAGMLLLTFAFAIAVALADPNINYVPGRPRPANIFPIIGALFDFRVDGPVSQTLAWTARLLLVALVVDVVFLVLAARRQSDRLDAAQSGRRERANRRRARKTVKSQAD